MGARLQEPDQYQSSTRGIPKSAVKYSNLWKPDLQKFRFPKSIRFKLYGFLSVIGICVVSIILSCFQFCDRNCPGLCNLFHVQSNIYAYDNRHFSYTLSRHLPQCIIIGVRKAGTRALLRYLSLHPDIVTATQELHFFNSDEKYNLSLEYYKKQMPYSLNHQITIEKTPAYFTEPMVPERVYRMNSSERLLLIVRDPVIRLISDYTQLKETRIKRNKSIIPFETEVFNEEGGINTHYKAIQTSIYHRYFSHWLEIFPLGQIHIVDGDKFITDPYTELHKVETFLGLEHRITKDYFYFNETKGFYCLKNGSLSTCLQENKGRKHPEVDPKLVDKLQQFYRPRNKLFFQMANRIFDWP